MKKYLILFIIVGVLFSGFAFAQYKEAESILTQIWSWVKKWSGITWGKIHFFLQKEVEKRKPSVEEEFKKETQELKEEVVEEVPSLWQRFKDLIYWTPQK